MEQCSSSLGLSPRCYQCWIEHTNDLTAFAGDTPVHRACYGVCLCCHSVNTVESFSVGIQIVFWKTVALLLPPILSVCKLTQVHLETLLSKLNSTLVFFSPNHFSGHITTNSLEGWRTSVVGPFIVFSPIKNKQTRNKESILLTYLVNT